MLKADRQFTNLARIYSIPRKKLLWQDVEKKYGAPNESNVEGYFIDDEPEIKEKEKPTGKERERERQDDRSTQQMRDDYEDYMQERDERYVDPYQDYPTFYG